MPDCGVPRQVLRVLPRMPKPRSREPDSSQFLLPSSKNNRKEVGMQSYSVDIGTRLTEDIILTFMGNCLSRLASAYFKEGGVEGIELGEKAMLVMRLYRNVLAGRLRPLRGEEHQPSHYANPSNADQ